MSAAARVVPFTKNREAIYDLLTRTKKFHCPVSGVYEVDAGPLLAAIERSKAAGSPVGIIACLVKLTGLLIKRYPRLNHHLFHGLLRKYEVAFDGADCNLIVMRKAEDGERVLFPVVIRGADTLALEEIERTIDHHKRAPLDELPQMEAIRRIERLPRLALKWFSFKVRSDYRFYSRYFGSYGLSALMRRGGGGVSAHTVANTGASFFPGTLRDKPVVVDGEVVVRPILSMMVVFDHYLVDGLEMLQAMNGMRKLFEDPTRLGLPPAPSRGK